MTDTLFDDIAPAHALKLSVSSYSNGRLKLTAPLKPNLNDKGTAFAGSITSILLLAGWGAITLRLKESDLQANVMAVKNETTFSAPVQSDFTAEAEVSDADAQRILTDLRTRQRSRLCIQTELVSDGNRCASMTTHFAIISSAKD